MSKKERGINRHRKKIFCSSCFHAALVLILVMGFWLGMSSPAHALSALQFDGSDDFAYVAFPGGKTFDALTLMIWVRPGTFDPYKEAVSAWVRAVDQLPPRNGYTKTSYSKFLLFQDKADWTRWGFQITTDSGFLEVFSSQHLTDPDAWYHIAVTYDSSIPIGSDNVFLYHNGIERGSGRVDGPVSDVMSIWFGRWVHAIPGAIGEIAGYGRALSQSEIQASKECGAVSEGRQFYWPLNEGSGNKVTDPASNLDLYLGDARDNDSYQPIWVTADYLLDTDGDGFADSCDNCPGIANDQADQDGDGAGNECDLCSNDGPGADGGACSYASVAVVGEVTGLVPTVTFNWGIPGHPAPDAYMVPQDCDNTVFECRSLATGELITPNCLRPGSYMVTVAQDVDGTSLNIPAGDLVLYHNGDSTTIQCDLLRRIPLEAFADGAVCRAIHIASTYDRDYDWTTGTCLRPPCIEPNDDFLKGQEFRGIVTSNDFTIAPTRVVPVNIKHTSFPNSINLSGGGVITVGIYSSGDFDAATVDPSTVRLLDRLSGLSSDPPVKSEVRDLSDTLCGDPGDIGACNPDSSPDLLLHFAVTGMPFTQDLQVTVAGQTFGGTTNFMGTDNLIVR